MMGQGGRLSSQAGRTTVRRMKLVHAILLAAAAQSDPIATEARGFLPVCMFKREFERVLCRDNQQRFVDTYARALRGDTSAILETAHNFGPHGQKEMSLDWLGLPTIPVEACAWRRVHLALENNTMTRTMARIACEELTPADDLAAQQRAARISAGLPPAGSK